MSEEITINELWEAGVQFGHKVSRWNPKMAPYIYGEKNNTHIIDLSKTFVLLKAAQKALYNTAKSNGRILFVGTKVQASGSVAECAKKCGQYYINSRWLGGILTNWHTISRSIKELEKLEKIIQDNIETPIYTKKEILKFEYKKNKLLNNLGGIRDMGGKPNLLVVLDVNKDKLAVKEANKLDIPVLGILDTNSNPDNIEYPVPGNDDAIRAISLYCRAFASSVLAGIEGAMVASGVDIGSMTGNFNKSKNVKKVTKIKQNKKINQTDVSDEKKEEFEEKLNN